MPELWERAPDATNRKLRELWERDNAATNRKLKELWAKSADGTNRKIFSGAIHWRQSFEEYGSADFRYERVTATHSFEAAGNAAYDNQQGQVDFTFDSPIGLPAIKAFDVVLYTSMGVSGFSLLLNENQVWQWSDNSVDGCTHYDTINLQNPIDVSTLTLKFGMYYGNTSMWAAITPHTADGRSFLLNNSGSSDQ